MQISTEDLPKWKPVGSVSVTDLKFGFRILATMYP